MKCLKLETIPNVLTILRLVLVAPLFIALLQQKYFLGFFLFMVSGFTDALDGFLARRFQCISRFGQIVDPVADKLMMLVTYVSLTCSGQLPLWLLIAVVGRDVWLVLGVVAYRWWAGSWDVEPSRISKLNTFLQILLAIAILTNLSLFHIASLIRESLIYLVLITTVASFVDYTIVWGKKVLQRREMN